MKASVRPVPLALLFSLPLLASARRPDLNFQGPWPTAVDRRLFESELRILENIERDFRNSPQYPTRLVLKLVEPWVINNEAGRSSNSEILLNQKLPVEKMLKTFRHELAHVYLNNLCSPMRPHSQLLQESFALLRSGDYLDQLERDKKFPTAVLAVNYLRAQNFLQKPRDRFYQTALSRLLSFESTRIALNRRFEFLFQSGEICHRPPQKLEKDIWETLSQEADSVLRGPLQYLIMDRLSGEILASKGQLDFPIKASSILKPILLHVFPPLMQSRLSRNEITWACPNLAARSSPRVFTWQEALGYSCNGFFLDAGRDLKPEWKKWEDFLVSFGISRSRIKVGSANEAIGLSEKVEMTLSEVASVYREISNVNPQLIDALGGSLSFGTLSQQKESQYFLSQDARLKSGTSRTPQGVPSRGWIAGRIKDFIVVATATGYGGLEILEPLKKVFTKWESVKSRTARIQILSLVPESKITMSCQNSIPLKNGVAHASIKFNELKASDRVRCLAGPIILAFPKSNGQVMKRNYWGEIQYSPTKSLAFRENGVTEKQARARRGSNLILETSERGYVARSLASEMAGGRTETLKALAFVIRQNLSSGRHSERPICDNTHCQVFDTADWANEKKLEKYYRAYDAISEEEIQVGKFLNFSAGGHEPWVRHLPVLEVARVLSISNQDFKLEIKKGSPIIDSRPVLCERLRSDLKLLACPEKIQRDGQDFIFSGRGEGHGLGLDLAKADQWAAQGLSYRHILDRFFQ